MNDELKIPSSVPRSSFRVHRFPTLYPITDRALTGLSHAEQVRRLIAGGARLIQIRDKHSSPAEVYAQAREALAVARAGGARLIVNDRADIALAVGADGLHLGQEDLPVEAARQLLGRNAIIGISTHSVAQARAAARLPVSYIAIGPVFPTASKENPDPVIGLEGVRRVREIVPAHIPLVAIGGITEANARTVLAAGADSVAVIGAVLAAADEITERARRFVVCLEDV